MPSRQRKWQLKQKAAGNCMACGQPRGPMGTNTYCEVHAARHSKSVSASIKRRKERGKA